jgi:hypothetical protein
MRRVRSKKVREINILIKIKIIIIIIINYYYLIITLLLIHLNILKQAIQKNMSGREYVIIIIIIIIIIIKLN